MIDDMDDDSGGDPPCWAHLFEDRAGLGATDDVLGELIRQLADGVVVADTDGMIVFWNAAAERIFGWPAASAVGASLDLIIPERQRRAHWDGYRKVMQTGQTRYSSDVLRVPSLHSDGERRSIAFTVTLLTDAVGAVTGIAAVVRDETQRWSEEQELRRRLIELGGLPDAT